MDGIVKKMLHSLGLTDVRKNRVSTYFKRGISRGQKWHVTIASSVITQPQILLCDEPMSGLDSAMGYQVASTSEQLRSYFQMSKSTAG
jgi:ATP-binding cassette, subfamily G (WHITE), member 2